MDADSQRFADFDVDVLVSSKWRPYYLSPTTVAEVERFILKWLDGKRNFENMEFGMTFRHEWCLVETVSV